MEFEEGAEASLVAGFTLSVDSGSAVFPVRQLVSTNANKIDKLLKRFVNLNKIRLPLR